MTILKINKTIGFRTLYAVIASDVKDEMGNNAKDGIIKFSATGSRIKLTHGSFETSLYYGIQLLKPIVLLLYFKFTNTKLLS